MATGSEIAVALYERDLIKRNDRQAVAAVIDDLAITAGFDARAEDADAFAETVTTDDAPAGVETTEVDTTSDDALS